MRTRLVIVFMLAALLLIVTACGGAQQATTNAATTAAASTSPSAAPVSLTAAERASADLMAKAVPLAIQAGTMASEHALKYQSGQFPTDAEQAELTKVFDKLSKLEDTHVQAGGKMRDIEANWALVGVDFADMFSALRTAADNLGTTDGGATDVFQSLTDHLTKVMKGLQALGYKV